MSSVPAIPRPAHVVFSHLRAPSAAAAAAAMEMQVGETFEKKTYDVTGKLGCSAA